LLRKHPRNCTARNFRGRSDGEYTLLRSVSNSKAFKIHLQNRPTKQYSSWRTHVAEIEPSQAFSGRPVGGELSQLRNWGLKFDLGSGRERERGGDREALPMLLQVT